MAKWDSTREETWRDVMEWRALLFPDKPAIVSPTKQVTYKQLNEHTNRVCNALMDIGVKKQERIAILSPDLPEFLEVACSSKAGFIPVPINWRFKGEEIAYVINDSGANTLFISQQFMNLLEPIKDRILGVKNFVCIDGTLPGMLSYGDLMAKYPPSDPEAEVTPADILAIIYTSGTTGLPKGVIKKHGDGICMMRLINGRGQIRPDDRILGMFPLFHAGLIHASFIGLLVGATQWILQKFDTEAVLETIHKNRITNLMGVPTMIIRIMEHPNRAKYDLTSLRSIVYTGSPMPVDSIRKALDIFGPVLYQGFGMTEGCGQMSLTTEDHILALKDPSKRQILGSVGKVLPGCQMIIVDENDKEVPQGQSGEIVWRSRCMIEGYWNKPKESAELLRNGWLHTGDIGKLDEDGYLYIVDRKKDLIVTGAEKVASKEVEEVIYSYPVDEVAVIGVPSAQWGEEVKAVVKLKPNVPATPEQIMAFCKQKLGGFKVPRSVEIWPDLPKNALGKIMKKEIREKYWAGREKRVS